MHVNKKGNMWAISLSERREKISVRRNEILEIINQDLFRWSLHAKQREEFTIIVRIVKVIDIFPDKFSRYKF